MDLKSFFISILLAFGISVFADINADITWKNIEIFNQKQNKLNCISATVHKCFSPLLDLVQEEKETRFPDIKSITQNCEFLKNNFLKNKNLILENLKLQNEIEKDFGPVAKSNLHNCTNFSAIDNLNHSSKLYYYLSRLNEGASKISQDRMILQKYLNIDKSNCPDIMILQKAHRQCVESLACKSNFSIDVLVKQISEQSTLYQTSIDELSKIEKQCLGIKCLHVKENLQAFIESFQVKYPMFLDEDFYTRLKKNEDLKTNLQRYFTKKNYHLGLIQNKIQKVTKCFLGQTSCDLDEFRETLAMMPLPNIDNSIRNESLYQYQNCIEEAVIDRNKTSKILSDVTRDGILLVATAGISYIPQLARFGLSSNLLHKLNIGGKLASISLDGIYSSKAWKDANKKCKNIEKKDFLGKDNIKCSLINSTFSTNTIELADCRMEKTLAALAILPLGPALANEIRTSKYFLGKDDILSDLNRIASDKKLFNIPIREKSKIINEVDAFQIDDSPTIDINQFSLLNPLKDGVGLGFKELYNESIAGQDFFLKVSKLVRGQATNGMRTIKLLKNEVAWVKKLSDLELGPKFYGLGYTKEGNYTIVTENIPGYHFNSIVSIQESLPKDFKPTIKVIDDLKRIRKFILDNNINAFDLQIRFNENKARIIDPEFFSGAKTKGDVSYSLYDLNQLISFLGKIKN